MQGIHPRKAEGGDVLHELCGRNQDEKGGQKGRSRGDGVCQQPGREALRVPRVTGTEASGARSVGGISR